MKNNNGNLKLFYHKTDGGGTYLMDTYIPWKHEGKRGKEGTINAETKYVVRIDGDITKDAELYVVNRELTASEVYGTWKCEECKEIAYWTYEDMAYKGEPVCPTCGCDMDFLENLGITIKEAK